LYQTVELKQKFISQIMTGKSPVRSCEDADESVLSYAEIKALAAGNPKIKEKMELDVQVAKLRVAKANHQNAQFTLQDKLRKDFPPRMKRLENKKAQLVSDIGLRNAHRGKIDEKTKKEGFPPMTLNGNVYEKRDEAGKELTALANAYHDTEPITIGQYRGFEMRLSFNKHYGAHQVTFDALGSYLVSIGDSAAGNITRINNTLDGLDEKLKDTEREIKDCASQTRMAQEQLDKPFDKEEELAEKSARLAVLNLELNINRQSGGKEEDELALSEDEEYEYRAELEFAGIDESELFRRNDADSRKTASGAGEELSKQGKRDELREEIEAGASLDIDGTFVEESPQIFDEDDCEIEETANLAETGSFAGEPMEKTVTSAELYGEKMNLSNYMDFAYPKAAQLVEIHDPRGRYGYMLADGDAREYRLILEGIVNASLQEHGIAERSPDLRDSNEEYHFIRDCAMSIVCKELEVPDFPAPPALEGFSGDEICQMREKGCQAAELVLYGHLPQAERDAILRSGSNDPNPRGEAGIDSGVKIASLSDYAEERKAIIAEAKRKLAEDGAIPIITDAMEGRAYEGEILEIGRVYAVQKIDEGRGIIHNLSYLKDFSRVINESGVPYLEITYDREMNGSIGTREAVQGRAASMGR
jgi:hypothetical protein